MPNTLKKLWSLGTNDNTGRVRRQIQLCNKIALLFALATAFPYQLFYVLYDFALYRPLFLANLLFMGIYMFVLRLNYKRKYTQAKNVLIVNTCTQLLVVNYFIGADAGVHLYYFTLAGILVFLYQKLSKIAYFSILTAIGSCFTISHYVFSSKTAVSPIPSPWVDIMYISSVSAVLGLLGVFLLFFRDKIDQAEDALKRKNKYLEKLSNTDPLTGLANRRVLDDTLEKEWARLARSSQPLSVIMCDVDYFKLFNDLYGHERGDFCLRKISEALRDVMNRPSDLIARYGGEEFAVVMPNTDAIGAQTIAQKICNVVADLNIPNKGSKISDYVTISVGGSSIEHSSNEEFDHQGFKQLLKLADQALYKAKANGRNQMFFQSVNQMIVDDNDKY